MLRYSRMLILHNLSRFQKDSENKTTKAMSIYQYRLRSQLCQILSYHKSFDSTCQVSSTHSDNIQEILPLNHSLTHAATPRHSLWNTLFFKSLIVLRWIGSIWRNLILVSVILACIYFNHVHHVRSGLVVWSVKLALLDKIGSDQEGI